MRGCMLWKEGIAGHRQRQLCSAKGGVGVGGGGAGKSASSSSSGSPFSSQTGYLCSHLAYACGPLDVKPASIHRTTSAHALPEQPPPLAVSKTPPPSRHPSLHWIPPTLDH